MNEPETFWVGYEADVQRNIVRKITQDELLVKRLWQSLDWKNFLLFSITVVYFNF